MSIENLFKGIEGLSYIEKQDFRKLTTMELVGDGRICIINSIKALSNFQKIATQNKIFVKIIGSGSNFLVDPHFSGVYAKLNLPSTTASEILQNRQVSYVLPGSIHLSKLTKACSILGLKGWEVFTGIPGSLGGSIRMNAGTNLGEIKDVVKTVWYMDENGESKIVDVNVNNRSVLFSYRKNNFLKERDIVYQVELEHKGFSDDLKDIISGYLLKRNKEQPMKEKTCGCVFKNYSNSCRAGFFLELLNLKGLTYKGLKISHKHANFIENHGEANLDDFKHFVQLIERELYLNYGIHFPLEVQF